MIIKCHKEENMHLVLYIKRCNSSNTLSLLVIIPTLLYKNAFSQRKTIIFFVISSKTTKMRLKKGFLIRHSLFLRRSARRSLFSKRKMAKQPPILSLPQDILHKILVKAGEVPNYQFRRIMKACHTFEKVMEEDWYCQEVDLWEMQIYNWPTPEFVDLKERCLQLQNPSALYLLGMDYLFMEGTFEEGLNLIRQASDKGYDLAIYSNACLRRIIHPTKLHNDNISREFVDEAKAKLYKDPSRPWYFAHGVWLIEKQALIDVQSIEKCKCVPNSWWNLPFKPLGACDECYWKAQTWCFAEWFTKGRIFWP